jgi:uncharacterized membrane protein
MTRAPKQIVNKGDGFAATMVGTIIMGLGLLLGLPGFLACAYPVYRSISVDLSSDLIQAAIGAIAVLIAVRFLARGVATTIRP